MCLEINYNLLLITLDYNDIIININDNYIQLHYSKNELINKHISYILTNLYNLLYKNIIIPNEGSLIILLDKNNFDHRILSKLR